MNSESEDLETRNDYTRLSAYATWFQDQGFTTLIAPGHKNRNQEIARICKENKADLLIMGSHGYKGWKDFIFGTTVNKVRHLVGIPVLMAK